MLATHLPIALWAFSRVLWNIVKTCWQVYSELFTLMARVFPMSPSVAMAGMMTPSTSVARWLSPSKSATTSAVVLRGRVMAAVQYSTVQYSAVQYSTGQYSTVQYSSISGDTGPEPEHCRLGWEEAPEHFFRRTAITSPDCQEFMVWRIFSGVTIFMSPLKDEFTLIEVF